MDSPDDPVPRAERAAWQYPFRSLLRGRGDARDGVGLERLDRRPAARDGGRRQPRVGDEHRGEKPAFLPDERLDLIDALAAFTMGSA